MRRLLTATLWTVALLGLAGCHPNFLATSTDQPIATGSTVFSLLEFRDPDERLNVVFVPDTSFGDMSVLANRQAFLDAIEEVIDQGYWQNQAYYINLAAVNYYYMSVSGTAAAPTTGICPSVTWPAQVDTDASFADVVMLLHTNELRDCRWGRKVTSEPTSFRTVVHESSHALFNLPDEYCCDGGYRVLAPVLYSSSASCNGDVANAAWRNCQSFTASSGTAWWRSEDSTDDIMSVGGTPVLEMGQGDWVVMRDVLDDFVTVGTPSVFAPATWDR